MDIVGNTPVGPSPGIGNAPARRAAAPAAAGKTKRRIRGGALLIAVPCLAVGALGGALVERHHAHGHQIIAAINGKVITTDDLFGKLQDKAGAAIMRQMAKEQLELQFASKNGASPTEAQVEAIYTEATKRPGFAASVAANHESPEDIKQIIRVELGQAKLLSKGVKVSDADLRRFYQINIDPKNPRPRYYTAETITVGVIVTQTQQAAYGALQQLDHGAAFETVARVGSKDTSAINGGIVGPFARHQTNLSRIPGLEDTMFNLAIGQQIGPRQFAGGWWIIRCLKKEPAIIEPFDKVQQDCRLQVALAKGMRTNGRELQQQYAAFRTASTLQAFWPQYKDALK